MINKLTNAEKETIISLIEDVMENGYGEVSIKVKDGKIVHTREIYDTNY